MKNDQVDSSVNYWLSSAEYDLEVSRSLFEKKKYHYSLFFGHSLLWTPCIRKNLKSYFCEEAFRPRSDYTFITQSC